MDTGKLVIAQNNGVNVIYLVLIASPVQIPKHDHADLLTRPTCDDKQSEDINLGITLIRISHIIIPFSKEDLIQLADPQRPNSRSAKHFD